MDCRPDKYCAEAMGLSLRNVVLTLYDGDKAIYDEMGEMLFTHFGVSGPLVLSASSHIKDMEPGRYSLKIDLKPALSPEKLDERIKRDFAENLPDNLLKSSFDIKPSACAVAFE